MAPLAISHDSYVKNTTDFLDKVTKIVSPANAMLFTMDVESFYTNIDNTAGLAAVKQAFSNVDNPDRPDKDILELLLIYLKNNDFQLGILPSDTWHGNGEKVPPKLRKYIHG